MKISEGLHSDLQLWHERTIALLGPKDYQDIVFWNPEPLEAGHLPSNAATVTHRRAKAGTVIEDLKHFVGVPASEVMPAHDVTALTKVSDMLNSVFDSRSMTMYIKGGALCITVAFSSQHKLKASTYEVLTWRE